MTVVQGILPVMNVFKMGIVRWYSVPIMVRATFNRVVHKANFFLLDIIQVKPEPGIYNGIFSSFYRY